MDMKHIRPIRGQISKIERVIDKLLRVEADLSRQMSPNLSAEELAPLRRRMDQAHAELMREWARQDRLIELADRQARKASRGR